MQNLQTELVELLKTEENLVIEGELNKNKIIELALKVDPKLIQILIKNETFKKHFFQQVGEVLVFDKIKFQRFVSNKSFLPDSYTAFKNKIGLTINDGSVDNYIHTNKDVVLAWPHKDCVLEGGQTKEDQKRNEIFWNETLAPDSVDRLLDAKAFTNFKKYEGIKNENEENKVKESEVSSDDFDITKENLILKGNNLLILSSLLKTHRGKIKLIYLDPPYNTGSDGFNYNDSFNHSAWLSFMKNRLIIAKELLSSDGSIWITLDENETHYCKIICDEIFNQNNFISTVIWKISDNSNNNATTFSEDHNQILVYGKNENWKPKFLNYESKRTHFKNPDNDPKGPWFDGNPVNNPGLRPNLQFDITAPNGNTIKHPPNGWRWSKGKIDDKIKSGEIRYNSDQTRLIRRTYLKDMEGLPPTSLWIDLKETGHTRQAKYEQKKLFPELPVTSLFSTPKPERLIKKIIDLSTEEGDIVLDFFAGSGTTASVAHKMNRQYIVSEQMDYIDIFLKERLIKVINGEQGGISKDVEWQGGGSFVYAELMQFNQKYIDDIQNANTKDDLLVVWDDMKDNAFISYQFDKSMFDKRLEAFKTASLEDMQKYLIEVLDKNQLYVNYSEIEDESFKVSKEDIELNKAFYKK